MSSDRGGVTFSRLASYSSPSAAMPVSSRLTLTYSSYGPRGSSYRASSLERGALSPLAGKLSSRLSPAASCGRRPPLPASEYRRRLEPAAARASPGRPPPGRRDASTEPDALSEARRYLQERRDRLTRSESREPAGAGPRALLGDSEAAGARRWRGEAAARERIVPITLQAERPSVGELRRQFDATRLEQRVDGDEEDGPERVIGGRDLVRPGSPATVSGTVGRQRTTSGGEKWERYLTMPAARARRDSATQLRCGTAENGEWQEPSSPSARRAALLSELGSGSVAPAVSPSAAASSSSSRRRATESPAGGGAARPAARQLGLTGLRNIGNTCFMNSVLQCLSNTRALHDYILRDEYSADINTTTSAMKGALIRAFAALMCDLWKRSDDSDRVLTTAPFKSQIQRFAPRFMGYQQQDAQEFLRYLLEGLHEDVNRVTSRPKPITTDIDDSLSPSQKSMEAWKRFLRLENSKFVDLFVGQLKSTLRCTVCGHASVTFDPFWDLSLPIPSKTGQVRLQACFDLFTKEEVLDGDEKPTCSKCQKRQKCTKSFSIQKFPRILVVHLKRFSPMERFRGKLNTTVDFSVSGLDLSPYSAGQGPCKYNLYGVANHSGTLFSGHYTAYCKHPQSGDWYEYNDSRVRPISMRAVNSSEAYVLFFELAGSANL